MRFKLNARIGAGTYLLVMAASVLVWSYAVIYACDGLAKPGHIDLPGLNTIVSGLGVALGLVFYPITASRLRDLNFPGWAVKVMAFPLLGVTLLPLLCFLSAPRVRNDFGPAPAKSGVLKILVAIVLLFWAMDASHNALLDYFRARRDLAG